MMDLLHKLLYTGIGVAALTEEKAKELVADLEKRGAVSSEEGKKLAQEMMEKARRHSQEFRRNIQEEVQRVLDRLKIISRTDFDQLAQRVEQLEQRCAVAPPPASGGPPESQDSL
ncbi:MAG: phasin family protein [Sedimentisphaerales bacterium]|nr:phasin family protein [Sedimentisphaerales bacterium]